MTTLHESQLRLQKQLDAAKTLAERNKLGQFATPPALASAIVRSTQRYLPPHTPVRFFDPAFGTGAFYAAVRQVYGEDKLLQARGVEIDPHYGQPAQAHWQATRLQLTLADFTQLEAPDEESKPNLLICNPPYTRHHHLPASYKKALGQQAHTLTGLKLSGLAGLYGYFLLLAHRWLAPNGLSCWLIPGEFLDVNYGREVKTYLLNKVKLLRIHRFDPADRQFAEALVSSVVVWFRREQPTPNDTIDFTFGGALDQPQSQHTFLGRQLNPQEKWSRLFLEGHAQKQASTPQTPPLKVSDLFDIKRGVATGANNFFILSLDHIQRLQLPSTFLTPILPSPRYLAGDWVTADEEGVPLLDKRLFLLNCPLSEAVIRTKYPTLWAYLQEGQSQKIHERYLCRHRSPWYAQEFRQPPPLLCTYMGRSQTPFKFILNQSKAIAPNVYLMLYPKPRLEQQIKAHPERLIAVWQLLKNLAAQDLTSEGRVYGGGLFKIEPRELGNVSLTGIEALWPDVTAETATQLALL